MPQNLLLEILTECEMAERFGEVADHVWADEWPRTKARVEARYVRTQFRPYAHACRMAGDLWMRMFMGDEVRTDVIELCPYGCAEHSVPIRSQI